MKVIFLDVDGVLNCIGWLKQNDGKPYDKNSIDPSRVELLKEIIDKTGAKIVLSSTWRNVCGADGDPPLMMYEYLVKSLKKCGIEIYSHTPLINNDRPREIRAWLDRNADTDIKFVSLDDDFGERAYGEQGIADRLIRTMYWDINGGLQQEHVEKAIKLLNE